MSIGRVLTASAALTLSACAALPPAPSASHANPAQYDLRDEFAALGGTNQPGQLAQVTPGRDPATTEVLVHGIGSGPDSLEGLIPQATATGHRVEVFLYDSVYRRLSDSSHDLASELVRFQQSHPNTRVHLVTHSMGGRVALDAVRQTQQWGQMPPGLSMQMVAPTLEGFAMADTALAVPDFIARGIGRTMPGKDMARHSAFQQRLEQVHLPPSVPVTIYAGDHDGVADYSNPRFMNIANHIGAHLVYVRDADHNSILTKVAANQTQYFTSDAPPHD
jgi:pimeloyl-ACP methyl ester carboxylesterase